MRGHLGDDTRSTAGSDVCERFTAARAGDRAALEDLVITVLPLVRRTAQRYASRHADVDDVVQESLATLVARLDDIRSPAAVEGWLWRVTVNAAHSIGRRHRRTTYLSDTDEPLTADGVEDRLVASLDRKARSSAVGQAFARLRPAERQLLVLLSQDGGNSYADVSRAVGCPVGSIGPSRQRALARLRSDPAIRRLREAG
jgi:RNA polymerase sigma factor (sigma-70 family)